MSKKIAEGTAALVLDVKVGSGAFMKTLDRARELAQTLVQLGNDAGVKTSALLTNMETPLGKKIGNALEVEESIEVLQGGGPQDVIDITVELAREMLRLAGKAVDDPRENLNNGKAMDVFTSMIEAQGGDLSKPLPTAKFQHAIVANETGYLEKLDALSVGISSWRLGAGRERKEDPVSFGAGIVLAAQQGDPVTKGQVLMTLHSDSEQKFERAIQAIDGAWSIGSNPVAAKQIILEKVS
jgi:thymidine phosphorylase